MEKISGLVDRRQKIALAEPCLCSLQHCYSKVRGLTLVALWKFSFSGRGGGRALQKGALITHLKLEGYIGSERSRIKINKLFLIAFQLYSFWRQF